MAHFLKTYVTATQNIRNGNTTGEDQHAYCLREEQLRAIGFGDFLEQVSQRLQHKIRDFGL